MDETAEWCNSFKLVPKPYGKLRLCLDPVRLNQALIRLVHRRPTLNDIFPKLNNAKYLSLIDASSGYYNLKLDEWLSYFTTPAWEFGWYRYKRLPFEAAPTGDLFQRKINEIFKSLPNICGIANNILVVGPCHTLWKVLQTSTVKPKTKQRQMLFQVCINPIFDEVISKHGVRPDTWKLKVLMEISLKSKRNSKHSLE